MSTTHRHNLDRSQRISRIIVSVTLIGVAVAAPAVTLGWFSVLPLLAIYPLITGVTGWDPVYDLLALDAGDGRLPFHSRVEQAITGGALIGSVFLAPPAAAAQFTALALAGVYPALSALIGEDLLQKVSGNSPSLTAQPGVAVGAALISAIDRSRRDGRPQPRRKAA